jgi:O-acetyl-ADP-ribose deacetylase (regulator of RNase III)
MTLEYTTKEGGLLRLIKGDITKLEVDAIVNAANSELKGGGGVDGAIHAAAGPSIKEETAAWIEENGKLETGRAMITSGGELPAKHIIHTVGPVWEDGYHGENTALEQCYVRSLKLARRNDCTSIAFPAISTGVYGFPKEKAAYIVVGTCIREMNERPDDFKEVTLVMYSDEDYDIWAPIFEEVTETMTGTPHM